MCSPVVLAGVQMASTAMSIQAQNQMLAANAQAQADYAAQNVRSTYSALNDRADEENVKVAIEKSRRVRQGMRERGTMTSRMAESGLAGNVAVRDLVGSLVWQSEDIGAVETGREMAMGQIAREKQGAFLQGLKGIEQAKATQKHMTSPLSATLQILGAGLEGYSRGKAMKAPFEKRGGETVFDTSPDIPVPPHQAPAMGATFMSRDLRYIGRGS